jgi:hypothetical protein
VIKGSAFPKDLKAPSLESVIAALHDYGLDVDSHQINVCNHITS